MGVNMEAVADLIDDIFRLDSASPPMLKRDGHLRPAVEAAFASMVMYFEERALAGEVPSILSTMCSKMSEADIVQTNPTTTYSLWGTAIKTQFNLDNLRLTSCATDTGMAQVVTSLQNMGRAIGGLHATLASVQRELAALGQAAAAASAPQSPAQPRSRSRTPVRSPAAAVRGRGPTSAGPSPLAAAPAAAGEPNEAEEPLPPRPRPPPPPLGRAWVGCCPQVARRGRR